MTWSIDPTWERNYSRIQDENGRTIAIIAWAAKEDISFIDPVKLFVTSKSMFAICNMLIGAWDQGGNQAHTIAAAIELARDVIEEIEGKE